MTIAPERARRRAAGIWSQRRSTELQAAGRFGHLASELAAVNAPASITDLALEAASDELRHADLCAELCRHFGGAAHMAPEAPPWTWQAPRELDRRAALLFELVALSCVTETLSTALLGVLVERATDSVARRTMQTILRDEVSHARVGWAYLAWETSVPARDAIRRHLPAMLRATFTDELFVESAADPSDTVLSGLGQLERSERRAVVRQTLEQVIFPGLARSVVNVESGKEWLAAQVGRGPLSQTTVAPQPPRVAGASVKCSTSG